MTKAAHMSETEKVAGHLYAALEQLNRARYYIGNDNPAYDMLNTVIVDVYEAERAYKEFREANA